MKFHFATFLLFSSLKRLILKLAVKFLLADDSSSFVGIAVVDVVWWKTTVETVPRLCQVDAIDSNLNNHSYYFSQMQYLLSITQHKSYTLMFILCVAMLIVTVSDRMLNVVMQSAMTLQSVWLAYDKQKTYFFKRQVYSIWS